MRNEGQLVKAIREYVQLLENKGEAYIIRNNTIRSQVKRKNGSVGFVVNGKAGSPDLIMCFRGHWIGIECKMQGNKQSPKQVEAQKTIEKAGGTYWLIYSFDEFRTKLDTLRGRETYVQPTLAL